MDHWWHVLHFKMRCDEASIMKLMTLSHSSHRGYEAAIGIINKLVKSVTDEVPLRRPSAYVVKSADNAFRELYPEGEQYAGQGGWRW